MERLLRWRFWKSGPWRGPPSASPSPGISILITCAPQSASWRTQVGPARTRVRSRTVKRSSAREPLGNGMFLALARYLEVRVSCRRDAGKADIPRSPGCCPPRRGFELAGGDHYVPAGALAALIG